MVGEIRECLDGANISSSRAAVAVAAGATVIVCAVALTVFLNSRKARPPVLRTVQFAAVPDPHVVHREELLALFDESFGEAWASFSPEQQQYFLQIDPLVHPEWHVDEFLLEDFLNQGLPSARPWELSREVYPEFEVAVSAIERAEEVLGRKGVYALLSDEAFARAMAAAQESLDAVKGSVNQLAWESAQWNVAFFQRRDLLETVVMRARRIVSTWSYP